MARRGKSSMFFRVMMRAALVRKGRALAALMAVGVAAAVATAMLILYVDTQAKLQKEFRSYGANLVIVGTNGASLPTDSLTTVDRVLAGKGIAVPFAYAVATTAKGKPVVVAGTDFAASERVESLVVGVEVAGCFRGLRWSEARADAGRFARQVRLSTLTYDNKAAHLVPAGNA